MAFGHYEVASRVKCVRKKGVVWRSPIGPMFSLTFLRTAQIGSLCRVTTNSWLNSYLIVIQTIVRINALTSGSLCLSLPKTNINYKHCAAESRCRLTPKGRLRFFFIMVNLLGAVTYRYCEHDNAQNAAPFKERKIFQLSDITHVIDKKQFSVVPDLFDLIRATK